MQERAFETNLALELVRVTEAAALAAGRWMGRGDEAAANQAAMDGMRATMQMVDMDGLVVIGEGSPGEVASLFTGERIGNSHLPQVDVGANAIDGEFLLARGLPNALSVLALTERGQMQRPREVAYMDKIAVGPEARGSIDVTASPSQNLRWVAKAKRCSVTDLTVVILDRPRNERTIAEVRAMGARVEPIRGGDVTGAIMTALPDTGGDILLGIGGTSEATLAAAALKCLGGEIQCRLWAAGDAEREAAVAAGLDFGRVYSIEDLVGDGDALFAATGVTDGDLLKGVQYYGGGDRTYSLVLHSATRAVRWITTRHSAAL